MSRLVVINGAPGSGKSTVAEALARDHPMALALDIDQIKHSLGGWQDDLSGSGLHARRLSLAIAGEHLTAGYGVVMGQYLVQADFLEQLERLAAKHPARFFEFVLDVDAAVLAERLAGRAGEPTRREHIVNNRLVGPEDAADLVASLEVLHQSRPDAVWIDAQGPPQSTLESLRMALTSGQP